MAGRPNEAILLVGIAAEDLARYLVLYTTAH